MAAIRGEHVQVWLDRDIRSRDFGVTVVITRQDGRVEVGKPVIFEAGQNEGSSWVPPTFRLPFDDAQALMDALWAQGIRPVEGQGSAGQLAAVQAHLNDMRAIASNNLGVILP